MVQNDPLTVILWLWNGWRPVYNHTHVNAMVGMLFDHLTIPHRTVCITDRPAGIECETYPLWELDRTKVRIKNRPGVLRPNSYRRLRMFSPWAAEAFPGRILSIDLDAIILKNIDNIPTNDDFKINRGRSCPYNGGMWQLRTGTRPNVWNLLGPASPALTASKGWVGSDQAWMSYTIPNAKTWDQGDGVFHYSLCNRSANLNQCRILFFAGATKPWNSNFASRFPKLAQHYARYLSC